MKLTVRQVQRFVALHDDWLELQSLRRNTTRAQAALAMLYTEQRRQPGLTRAEVARRMGKTQTDLDRMLGLASAKGSARPGQASHQHRHRQRARSRARPRAPRARRLLEPAACARGEPTDSIRAPPDGGRQKFVDARCSPRAV